MTLSNKIIFLLLFIVISSAIVFYWFTQRLFQKMNDFHSGVATQRQIMETQFAAGVEELQRKREQLKQEVATHLSQMNGKLAKNQERAEEFDREFLKGQNNVFIRF